MSYNPLVAGRVDEPVSAWSGVWVAEDIELVGQGVRDGNWVDGSLGVVSAGLDGLALVSDPTGALLQYGISWLIEHVRPLSQALEWLAGDPGAIAGQAQTWRTVAGSLRADSDAVARAVRFDLTEWSGAAAAAYARWAGARDRSLRALGSAADTMAAIVEGAGALVGTVRVLVRDAVAAVVSRLVVYAAELVGTLGLATPLVVGQVSALCAAWAARIAGWLHALINSLRRLMHDCQRLGELVEALTRRNSSKTPTEGGKGSSRPSGKPRTDDPTFDPGKHKGALGDDFQPGVVDPRSLFEEKEYAIAVRLADNGEMIHPRERLDNVQKLKNPDAVVRTSPLDPGTVTEFKTLGSATSNAVKANILEAGHQVSQSGGGEVVIDGRMVALDELEAQRGYARALGQARAHGSALPHGVRIILGDGSIIRFL
jgi:hypothetical protein